MTSSPQFTLSRVLCPTDFSDFSTAAASYAAALAAPYGGTLRLLHVAPPGDAGDTAPITPQRVECYKALEKEAERIRRPGLAIEVDVREGSPVHETLAAAADWGANLIVLGTHGRGGMERLVLGSVAEKLLRKAQCAVLAVPHAALERAATAERIGHVLCAHDGSAASATGVAYALSLAERTGARVTLVTAIEALPEDGALTGSAFAAFHEARETHAHQALEAALPSEVRTRENVQGRLIYGHPGQQIVAAAAQEQADLVVMGVQGRGAIDLLMFGSTVNHVVRHASCPVLTVRPPAAAA